MSFDAATFQKVCYVTFSAIFAILAWFLASVQFLNTGHTQNFDHIETLEKELLEFKNYETTRRQTNEQAQAHQDAEIDLIRQELIELQTRMSIHIEEDKQKFKPEK